MFDRWECWVTKGGRKSASTYKCNDGCEAAQLFIKDYDNENGCMLALGNVKYIDVSVAPLGENNDVKAFRMYGEYRPMYWEKLKKYISLSGVIPRFMSVKLKGIHEVCFPVKEFWQSCQHCGINWQKPSVLVEPPLLKKCPFCGAKLK